jgi:uncharacterized protein (TIGR02611 family)
VELKRAFDVTYRSARRVAIAVIGGTVILAGVAMLVLPGPGLLTIAAGLALLGLEFAFARRWLATAQNRARSTAARAAERIHTRRPPEPPPSTK